MIVLDTCVYIYIYISNPSMSLVTPRSAHACMHVYVRKHTRMHAIFGRLAKRFVSYACVCAAQRPRARTVTELKSNKTQPKKEHTPIELKCAPWWSTSPGEAYRNASDRRLSAAGRSPRPASRCKLHLHKGCLRLQGRLLLHRFRRNLCRLGGAIHLLLPNPSCKQILVLAALFPFLQLARQLAAHRRTLRLSNPSWPPRPKLLPIRLHVGRQGV